MDFATHLPGQPYCPRSCAPEILRISTKLHHKPLTVQAITKEFLKKGNKHSDIDVYVAGGYQMIHTRPQQPPFKFKHLFYCGNKASILELKKSVSEV